MPLKRVVDMAELDRINESLDNEIDRIEALSNVYSEFPPNRKGFGLIDPFSADYLVAVRDWLSEITGRGDYDPARDELSNYLAHHSDAAGQTFTPSIYGFGDSVFLGDMLQSFGAILKLLGVRRGQSVLEYGSGDGQISLALARMGCRVTAVDIEPRYLESITTQATAMGTSLLTVLGPFGTAEPDCKYDRILFFESFHHALEHQSIMKRLRDQLSPGGWIIFAGEPILAADSHFRCTLPYPWGPRLDGLSLRAMRSQGWCELGFTREYFVEMLMRAGFIVEFLEDATTARASAYKAIAADGSINLGNSMLVEAVGMPNCWHPGEGKFRFMREPVAGIPVDGASGWRSVLITLHNILPLTCNLLLTLDSWQTEISFQPGESRDVEVPIAANGGTLRLECPVYRPSELSQTSNDNRSLGIAASLLRYQ